MKAPVTHSPLSAIQPNLERRYVVQRFNSRALPEIVEGAGRQAGRAGGGGHAGGVERRGAGRGYG